MLLEGIDPTIFKTATLVLWEDGLQQCHTISETITEPRPTAGSNALLQE